MCGISSIEKMYANMQSSSCHVLSYYQTCANENPKAFFEYRRVGFRVLGHHSEVLWLNIGETVVSLDITVHHQGKKRIVPDKLDLVKIRFERIPLNRIIPATG